MAVQLKGLPPYGVKVQHPDLTISSLNSLKLKDDQGHFPLVKSSIFYIYIKYLIVSYRITEKEKRQKTGPFHEYDMAERM